MAHRFKKISTRTAALVIGAVLTFPALTAHAATTPYAAQDNDTFWKLSKELDIPLGQLLDANPHIDPHNIYQGLTLLIPSKATIAPKVTAKAVPAVKEETLETNEKATPVQAVTTISGQSLSFSKVIDIKATAYSASAEENGKWGPVDYFGNPLKLGTIAVDPKVIPFGTKVYITGYDFSGLPTGGLIATASDKGGAIKGKRIDIFVPGSRAFVSKFGRQNVKVYILK